MTENLPKVSIVIPSYNYGHLIAATLSCLQDQSYKHWHAIIVDDGSTDNTREIVDNFTRQDNRFSYLYQQNSGVSIARNNGLKQIAGEFVQFLDADDLVSKEKLSLQVKYLQNNPEVDIVNVNTRYFHTDRPNVLYTDLSLSNTSKREEVKGRGMEAILELIEHNPIVVQGPLFKREILDRVQGFVESMKYLEDWDFWVRIALHYYRFDHIDHPGAVSLVRAHSVSASRNGTQIQEGEGFFRNRLNILIKESPQLTEIQKDTALRLNLKELKNTYKYLMAKTPLIAFGRFKAFYQQMQDAELFFSCLIKSLNLRRKMKNGRKS